MRKLLHFSWPYLVILSGMAALFFIMTSNGKAHWNPGTHNAVHAIQLAFCGKSNLSCGEGNEAIIVAKCESSSYWYQGRPQEALNGQYRGMFQMGSSERATYGHGPDPWKQAFAARRYFVASKRENGGITWIPWTCKP